MGTGEERCGRGQRGLEGTRGDRIKGAGTSDRDRWGISMTGEEGTGL